MAKSTPEKLAEALRANLRRRKGPKEAPAPGGAPDRSPAPAWDEPLESPAEPSLPERG